MVSGLTFLSFFDTRGAGEGEGRKVECVCAEPSYADCCVAYGDMNLFCTCGPVEEAESVDGITGAAAPAPT